VSFGARADIRLDALRANFKFLASQVPEARVMAAVKANAYGHGLVAVARALGDVDALAVARLVEAEALRSAGLAQPIVLMGGVIDEEELARAAELACDIVAHSPQQVTLLETSDVEPLKTWIKVDTGMHRLGFDPKEVPAAIDRLASARSARDLGLMTHLANADDRADSKTLEQTERLAALARDFTGDVSVANSAALLGWSEPLRELLSAAGVRSTWVRPGISLYGISPLQGHSAADFGLEPVMNFDTCLLSVKRLRAGEPVGEPTPPTPLRGPRSRRTYAGPGG